MGQKALAPRKRQALEFIADYRLPTLDALRRFVYPGLKRAAATNELGALRKDGLLVSHENAIGKKTGYQLTEAGARVVAATPRTHCQPVQGQTLAEVIGVLSFCCLGAVARPRLREHELERTLGISISHPYRSSYYLDTETDPAGGPSRQRLGRILVPRDAKVDSTIAQIRRTAESHASHPQFGPLMKSGQLAYAVVLPNDIKADAFRNRVLDANDALPVWTRVAVAPELETHFMSEAP